MCKVRMLRALVKQRLTAAAEEIFGLFERTIAEYEEELGRSKEEKERLQRRLDAVFSPQLRLHRADIQQLSVVKDEVPPEQQEWSSSLDQEDPEPPRIEEQQDLWTSQEGEQLQGLEEADTKFTFTPVPVKTEDEDDEKPHSSQLHHRLTEQIETEADGEDCGGPEAARNSDPDTHPEPETVDKPGDSSEPEANDSDYWEETREPQSVLNSLNDDEVLVSDSRCNAGENPFSCSDCGKGFSLKTNLKRHMRSHTGEKPFSCSVCSKTFSQRGAVKIHMRSHTGEIFRLQRLLDTVFNPQLRLHRADVQQLSVVKDEVPPEQQEWSSSLDQEDPEPPRIREEQQDLWTSQEGEQLQGLEEADTKFTFTPVPVKTEDEDDEKPHSSQLHHRLTEQTETEVDGEDCGGPEAARNSDPDTHPEPETVYKTGNSSELETDDSDDWEETREPQSGLNSLNDDEVLVSDSRCNAGENPFSCSDCGKGFSLKTNLKRHMRSHTGEKPFSCSVCGREFRFNANMKIHMRTHTGEKPFSCSVCSKTFSQRGAVKIHMRSHTGEKPFSCSVCSKAFRRSTHLKMHMRTHTREKLFSCSVCNKAFSRRTHFKIHLRTHTREKPFSCSVCSKTFSRSGVLKSHMRSHTTEIFRLQRLLDTVFNPQLRLHRADVQQLSVVKDEVPPEQQEWSSSLDQEDPEPPRIREEQQDLWTSQEGEQLQGLEEADTKFTFTPVPVKTEDEDDEKPHSSQLHHRLTEQIETEADGEDCGGPEAARNSDPDTHPEPETVDKPGNSSEPAADDSDDWEETREPQSGLNSLNDDEVLVSDSRCNAGEKPFRCSDCGKGFSLKRSLARHMRAHPGEKPFSCSNCGKAFPQQSHLKKHMRVHPGEKPFSCSVCGKGFSLKRSLTRHMKAHPGEKPFSCSNCGKAFPQQSHLKKHMRAHPEEKPFSSSLFYNFVLTKL